MFVQDPPAVTATPSRLTRFRLRCLALGEGLMLGWLAAYGIGAGLIIQMHGVFQRVAAASMAVGAIATVLVILSGCLEPAYWLGRRAEIRPARVGRVLALLIAVWGIELAKDFSATLFNATHARVELVPETLLTPADGDVGPAVVLYGTLSRQSPALLTQRLAEYHAEHPQGGKVRTMYLSSTGGDTIAIQQLAKIATDAGIERTIAFGDCVSACATLWLLLPQPQLARDSALCFHGSHYVTANKAAREIDAAIREAILQKVDGDAARHAQAAHLLDEMLGHGLWELTCPTPQRLADAGLVPAATADEASTPPFPEGVGRWISANPPGCLLRRRMPKLPGEPRDPKDDGCRLR